jgi:hypothetical protein
MGNPGLDPETTLRLIHTLLYCIAYILGGLVLLVLSAYVVFVCWEIFPSLRGSKTLHARVPQPIGCFPVAEENLDPIGAETPIPAEAESLKGETVPVSSLPHDAQVSTTPGPVNLESEPTRAVVSVGTRPSKPRSRVRTNTQLENPA